MPVPQEPTESAKTIARLGAKKGKLQAAIKAIRDERDAANAKITEMQAQIDVILESGSADQVVELKGQIRQRDHRDVWRELAKEAGVKPKAVDRLFQLSGWKADADAVDRKAMAAALEGLRESDDYAFEPVSEGDGEGQGGSGQRAAEKPVTPGERPVPGGGRGKPHNPSKSGVVLTKNQLADPKFMLDPRNKDIIQSAAKEGRFRLPDREGQ
jgi:hypothetical protein